MREIMTIIRKVIDVSKGPGRVCGAVTVTVRVLEWKGGGGW